MVKGFPFEVPKEYAQRPLLLVREATADRMGGIPRDTGLARVPDLIWIKYRIWIYQTLARQLAIISPSLMPVPTSAFTCALHAPAPPSHWLTLALPQGRATLAMRVQCKDTPEGPQTANLTVVLDGYNAPVSAGQFMDLVNKGFYNGMEIQRWGEGGGGTCCRVLQVHWVNFPGLPQI